MNDDPLIAAHARANRERDAHRATHALLSRAVMLLQMERDRREARGQDASALRDFIKEATL